MKNPFDFQTPDEAADFLMWFGRSAYRHEISPRTRKGVRTSIAYRAEVARCAQQHLEDIIHAAERMAAGSLLPGEPGVRDLTVMFDGFGIPEALPNPLDPTDIALKLRSDMRLTAEERHIASWIITLYQEMTLGMTVDRRNALCSGLRKSVKKLRATRKQSK